MPAMAREMPGRFGAMILPRFSPLKPGPPRHLLSRPSLTIVSLRIPTTTLSLLCSCSAMAANEVQEPLPKVPKLSENGVHKLNGEVPQQPSLLSLLRVKKLSQNAILPTRASALAAGYDLSSAVETKVPARGKALVPTDLSIAIPEGTYARIAPRSGLAWKHSIDVGAGVIDADYRGPVGVVLFNHSDADFEVKPGDRIAQLIIERIVTPEVAEVDDLDDTVRGAGGFGSTGV